MKKVSSCQPKPMGDIITYYAGAKFAENEQDLLSNGGRVYMLATTADTVKDAQNTIYSQLDKQKTEASSTEQISEARQLSKDIRKATQRQTR